MSDLIKQNFELRKENEKLKIENSNLKRELKKTQNALSFANNRIKQLEKKFEDYKKDEEVRIQNIVNKAVKEVTEKLNKEHEKEVNELKGKISRLEKKLNTDSTNSSLPTSKDRIGKHKIQNNREKTDKSIGGQKNHEIHKLNYFKDEEITETKEHTLDKCPNCGGKLKEVNIVRSDIIDIEVKVTKVKNNIHNYKCTCCHKNISSNSDLPRGVSYGNNVNSTVLAMMNEANTPLNKIVSLISGMTNNEINMSESYLKKIEKRYSNKLESFIHDLKEKVISLKNVFWDDTVVKIGIGKPAEGYDDKDSEYLEKIKNDDKLKNKKVKNGIIRFYGDNEWAYIVGHRTKKSEDVDSDGILENLTKECTVMHDHVLLNYNDKYNFRNAECNEHIKRYLKGNMDMFPDHTWAEKMRSLLIQINKEKKELIEKKINSFTEAKINKIEKEYDEIIKLGYEENDKVKLEFIINKNDELNLIERLEKFKENHLLFVKDFSVDFTNNTAEKGLRLVKRKVAVSFMFKNSNRMKEYATILSYLETCYRHGISRFDASKRLVSGTPYTVKELSDLNNDVEKK